jgi:hypothetical protein
MTAVTISAVSLLAVLAYAPPSFCAQSVSDAPVSEIVARSVVANTADWNAQPQYSHRERDLKSKVDANGHAQLVQSKTYERFMLEGSPYSRLVEIDGHPVNAEQQQQEQIKLNAETARRRNESSGERQTRVAKYQAEREEEHLLMQQMVTAFTFSLAGEQRIEGVECYVLDARPNPAYNPPVEKARVLLGMAGRLWIDKEQYHWVKVQAQVINPVPFGLFVAKVKPGTRFELEQSRTGDVWLPSHFSESVNATVFGFYGVRSSEEELYSDYQPDPLRATHAHTPVVSEIAAR